MTAKKKAAKKKAAPKKKAARKKKVAKEVPDWKTKGFESEEYYIHYRRLMAIQDFDEAEKYRPQDKDGINSGTE
tara:strand:+ start:344 stop:565 length:222 start_codon:yes stop_codon:yes gene_type:complete